MEGSAIEIVKDTDDWPIALHVLNSKRLGKVEVDPNTWAFEGVHYADLPTNDDLLKAEDLIYFTINDDHVTPRSIHYGLSILEPVIDASETKRIIKQEDLKKVGQDPLCWRRPYPVYERVYHRSRDAELCESNNSWWLDFP